MKMIFVVLLLVAISATTASAQIRIGGGRSKKQESLGTFRTSPYDPNSITNPYGAGSRYKTDGLLNPYSRYGSPFSPYSWRNPYATQTPQLYENGQYRGKLSTNPYDPDSISNPYGKYGSPFSPYSINNPYGAGSPYSTTPIYVRPGN
jgi:hypothetical protein